MVEVKGVTSEEVIELMAQQPLGLRKGLQKLCSMELPEIEPLLIG